MLLFHRNACGFTRVFYIYERIYIYFFTFHPFFFQAKSVYQHAFLSIPLFFHPWAHNGFRDYRARKLFSGFCLFLLRFKGWKINLPVELLPPATAAFVLPYVILSFFVLFFGRQHRHGGPRTRARTSGSCHFEFHKSPSAKVIAWMYYL